MASGHSNNAWIANIFCPTLGMIIANVMWLSSLPAVLESRRKRSIGKLNPLPYVSITHNCLGWSTYAILTHDYFLYYANIFGLVLGLIYCSTCLSILYSERKENSFYHVTVQNVLFGGLTIWLLVFSIVFIDNSNIQLARPVVGYMGK